MPKTNPYELVRVRGANGHEYTTTRAAASADGITVLDKPARDPRGQVVPTKYRTPRRPGQFDPSSNNVDDVIAHLEAADDDERQRVLSAESDGKNRSTITGWQPPAAPPTTTPEA